MKVLDVGCGVAGPAREIAKFAGVDITGLNNNDYQIQRAKMYAEKAGLTNQLRFVKGDFMVSAPGIPWRCVAHPFRSRTVREEGKGEKA